MRQVVLELEAAVECLATPDGDVEDWLECLARATDCVGVLAQQAALLNRLPLDRFAAFRRRIGAASGAQSAQFQRVRTVLGMHSDAPGPLFAGYLRLLEHHGRDLVELVTSGSRGDPLFRMSQALADLAQAVWSWQTTHLAVVNRMIGHRPGTGGTTGLGYLAGRLHTPFSSLWHAHAEAHGVPVA